MNKPLKIFLSYNVFISFFIVAVIADAQVIRRKEAPETVKEFRSGTPQYEHHIEPHKMDGIAKKTEYDKNLFLSDPIYKEEPYDAKAQIQVYGGKKAVPTVRPWIELGYPLYDEGPIGAGHDIIGRKNLVRPQFLVHGDFRTAVAFNDNGLLEVGQVATRLNLDLDFKILNSSGKNKKAELISNFPNDIANLINVTVNGNNKCPSEFSKMFGFQDSSPPGPLLRFISVGRGFCRASRRY